MAITCLQLNQVAVLSATTTPEKSVLKCDKRLHNTASLFIITFLKRDNQYFIRISPKS